MARSALTTALVIVLAGLVVSAAVLSMAVVASYPLYLDDLGNERACADAYGPNATYLGTTGQATDNGGVLCRSGDEVHIIEGRTAPMNWETFTSHVVEGM